MSQAAKRALMLLEQVARATAPVGLLEIASVTGLDKTTCSRLLGLLVERGWLVRDSETKKYSIGPTLVGLSMSVSLPDQVRLHMFPLLNELREVTGETVSLQRRFGNLRVCVAGLESREPLRRGLPIGDALPVSAGPSGKVILAFAGTEALAEANRDLDDARRARLRTHLEMIRQAGYLSTDGDRTAGVGAISVPLFARAGVYGSLTVAGPSSRFDSARRQAALLILLTAASNFSALLGGDASRYTSWLAAADTSVPATHAPQPRSPLT